MSRINVLAEAVKGLKANIFAVDNLSPVSRVAVYVKAGSRYEPDEHPGISHFIRASAGLTNRDSSAFGIVRYMERNGTTLKVSSDREHIIYHFDCLRNKIGNILCFVDDILHKPEFRPWELVDIVRPKLAQDIKYHKKNQVLVANEAMHKAAFRGGLAHSTVIPEHRIDKISKDHLFDFFERNFVLSRMSFVGLGVDENDLQKNINENFELNGAQYNGVSGETRYVGGEARIQADFPHTMVNFVVEGYPISDLKAQAALEIIGTILGDTKQAYIKYGSGPGKSLSSVLLPLSPKLKSSVINIGHSDTGLFGISIMGPDNKLKEGVRKAVGHVKKVISNISDAEIKSAKDTLRIRSLIASEDPDLVFKSMCLRHANGVAGRSPLDALAKLTKKDVQEVASKLMKTKPTLISIGNPRFVPYVDELDS